MPNHADLIKRLEENWHKVECLFGQAETAKTARDRGYFLGLARHRFQDMQADIREAAAALRELTEWRPIETAPKDGAKILVCGDVLEKRMDGQRIVERRYTEVTSWFREKWPVEWMDGHEPPTGWLPLPPEPEGE